METKKLKVMRGSKEHPELVQEWLESQGATNSSEILGCIYNDCYYFVDDDGIIRYKYEYNWIWDFIDHEVVELEEPKPKPKHVFQPFEKVLVRNVEGVTWYADFFGCKEEDGTHCYACVGGFWDECIPYEGNEHLLGTTDNPKGGER